MDSTRRVARESAGTVAYVVSLPQRRPVSHLESARPVPDVRGLPLRDAVHSLFRAGFKVRLVHGADGTTDPPAGTLAPAGAAVRLFHDF